MSDKRYFKMTAPNGEVAVMDMECSWADAMLNVARETYPQIEEIDAARFRKLFSEIEAREQGDGSPERV